MHIKKADWFLMEKFKNNDPIIELKVNDFKWINLWWHLAMLSLEICFHKENWLK